MSDDVTRGVDADMVGRRQLDVLGDERLPGKSSHYLRILPASAWTWPVSFLPVPPVLLQDMARLPLAKHTPDTPGASHERSRWCRSATHRRPSAAPTWPNTSYLTG